MADALDGEAVRVLREVAEALALEELHHEVGGAVGQVAEVRDVDDVRVADARRGLRFLQEAVEDLAILCQIGAEDLHGDLLVDHLVAREIDEAHPAFAEQLLDLVAVVEGGADVGVGRIGLPLFRN